MPLRREKSQPGKRKNFTGIYRSAHYTSEVNVKDEAYSPPFLLPNLPRRRFIQGLAAGGILLVLSPLIKPVWARERAMANTATGMAPVLTGTEFDLTVGETLVNFTGAPRMAVTINGSIPAPTLHWREGDTVTLRVHNRLAEDTSIHWHGILLPFEMDGVPGIIFKGIPPGETFTYHFKVAQTGTYWYHSHSGMQEQRGMYGAVIITPATGRDPIRADRDYVVQLSDWTDEDPMRVLTKLKMQSDYYNFNQPTVVDFFRDVSKEWLSAAPSIYRPGYLRVDSAHQGDLDGIKGVYHINAVDCVTQYEGVATCEKISEAFLIPVLEALLLSFPFVIHGFHSDNGSEYINKRVAKLLNKLLIEEQIKSRSRHSNDNAQAESKNGAIVRKHLGYSHIPQCW